jgi:penicillin-binding protein 1C
LKTSVASRRNREASPLIAFGIQNPRDGSVFALDPDMPAGVQRIRFEGEAGQWVLDGRRLGAGTGLAWSPRAGRHELTLLADDGQPVQTVRFEVRALGGIKAVGDRKISRAD